jgi:hypothetical protein
LPQSFYESAYAFGGGFFLQSAVGNPQIALVFDAESHAGDDGDFVQIDQLPD